MDKEKIQIIALSTIMSVAVFVGTIVLLIKPDVSKKTSLGSQLSKIAKEIKENKGIASKLEPVKKEIVEVEKKIQNYNKTMITLSEFRFFKDTLRDIGQEHNVSVNRDKTQEIDDSNKSVFKEEPEYIEKAIELNLTANYHDFGEFLNRIEKTTPFRKIISFTISKGRSRNTTENLLKINLKILSLMFDGAT